MSWKQQLPVIALLAILAIVYWPIHDAGFSPWDDRLYTTENPLVHDGFAISKFLRAFTVVWENNWTPLFWGFLALQVSLGGLEPYVFHAGSILLSLLNAWLLFICLTRFKISYGAALIATAMFALHPLRVETVAWIASQKHLLAAMFLLLSLILYQTAKEKNVGAFHLLGLGSFSLSLMSSQAGVGLPLVLLFLEIYTREGNHASWKREGMVVIGYFLLALGAAVVVLWVNWRPSAQTVAWFDHALSHHVLQMLATFGWQAVTLVWPWRLATFYPWPTALLPVYAAFGVLLMLVLVWRVWKKRHDTGFEAAGVFGFFVSFLPVSGILSIPITFTADRLSYVPSLFLMLALGSALDVLREKKRNWLLPLCALISLLYAPLSFRQAGFWKNEETIVNRTLGLYPDSISAQINKAVLIGMQGDTGEALTRLREIRNKEPFHEVLWLNEMLLHQTSGQMEESINVGKEAVQVIPNSFPLTYQLAIKLAEQERYEEAVEYFQKACVLRPKSVQPMYQYARVLILLGKANEAFPLLNLLELSLQKDPDYWDLCAVAYEQAGDSESATIARKKAAGLRSH